MRFLDKTQAVMASDWDAATYDRVADPQTRGGSLVAQCGGAGNVASVLRVLAELGERSDVAHFATPEETVRRLLRCGFGDVWAWLQPEPVTFPSDADLETFLATVVLRSHLDGLADPDRSRYVHRVAQQLPRRQIDYVRLNILARRG